MDGRTGGGGGSWNKKMAGNGPSGGANLKCLDCR